MSTELGAIVYPLAFLVTDLKYGTVPDHFSAYDKDQNLVVTITRNGTERNAWFREIPILRNTLKTS